jgi:hypothetical protein
MENTRKELIAFLKILDSEKLRLIADGNMSEEQAVDAYLKVSDKGATAKEPLTADKKRVTPEHVLVLVEKAEQYLAKYGYNPASHTVEVFAPIMAGFAEEYASSRTVVPSDEEIERAFPVSSPIKALSVSYIEKQLARIEGAKWMRKLIEERSSK